MIRIPTAIPIRIKLIMKYAVEGGILRKAVDIEAFSNEAFSSKITEQMN